MIAEFEASYPDCQYYLNHCTGKNAIDRLTERMVERVHALPAGSVVEFAD